MPRLSPGKEGAQCGTPGHSWCQSHVHPPAPPPVPAPGLVTVPAGSTPARQQIKGPAINLFPINHSVDDDTAGRTATADLSEQEGKQLTASCPPLYCLTDRAMSTGERWRQAWQEQASKETADS